MSDISRKTHSPSDKAKRIRWERGGFCLSGMKLYRSSRNTRWLRGSHAGIVPPGIEGGQSANCTAYTRGCDRNRRKAESSFSWGEGSCIWSFAPGRFGGVVGSWERVAGGDASGWLLEGFTNAKPLCRRGAC